MNLHDLTARSTERRFDAMGSRAHVIVVGEACERLADEAVHYVDRLERMWSRFDPSSDVSRLNATAGCVLGVRPETIALIERSEIAFELTGGSFDALVGDAVAKLGYDRSFDEFAGKVGRATTSSFRRAAERTFHDCVAARASIPAGARFDPGGIGKGLAADIVVRSLRELGAEGAMVNLGGDIVCDGVGPDGGAWTIDVGEPLAMAEPVQVTLTSGAVATSTSLKRRWATSGGERHHIVDPTTGVNPVGDVVVASVIAGEGWWAEAAATSLIGGALLIDPPPGVAVQLVSAAGEVRRYGDFAEYVLSSRATVA